jgi:hypothetical protein
MKKKLKRQVYKKAIIGSWKAKKKILIKLKKLKEEKNIIMMKDILETTKKGDKCN